MEEQALQSSYVMRSAQEILLREGSSDTPTSPVLTFVGKVIAVYQLLDAYLDACGWPIYPTMRHIPRQPRPEHGQILGRIMGNLTDWPSIIPNMSHLPTVKSPKDSPVQAGRERLGTNGITIPESQMALSTSLAGASTESETQEKDPTIQNFLKYVAHHKISKVHEVLEQWHAVGFGISAIQPVSLVFTPRVNN
jgi:hypothetical protein